MTTLLLAALLAVHPGHGSMALVGTLVAVAPHAITVDVREVGSGAVRRMVVTTTPDTKLRLGKQAVPALEAWVGAPVVVTVDYEEGVDGRTIYTADKVQVTPPKARKR